MLGSLKFFQDDTTYAASIEDTAAGDLLEAHRFLQETADVG